MASEVLVVEDTQENLELMTYLLKAFGHTTLIARDGAAGMALAREAKPDVVVMDLQMPIFGGLEAAAALRDDPETAGIPLVAVTAYAMVGDRDKILAAGFDGYIAKPIDPETFVQQVEAFLPDRRRALPATSVLGDVDDVEDLSTRARRVLAERLGVVHAAAVAAEAGSLEPEQRRDAARQAHRLAGAAASYGYPAATEPARAIEAMLEGDDDVRPLPLAMSLRTLRSAMSAQTPSRPADPDPGRTLAIAVVGDRATVDSLDEADTRHRVVIEHVPAAGPVDGWAEHAHVVVLDLATAGPLEASLEMLDGLAARSTPPAVLVLAGHDDDRVALADRGARGYHDRGIDGHTLLNECQRVLGWHTARQRVLVIDDDELITAGVTAALEPAGFQVVTADPPTDIEALLEKATPDLLVLNVDLAGADGIQLCRRLRGSPTWAKLPVVFLTAARDAASIDMMFRSGADDYVAKPVVGSELLVRVRNRLDRVQVYRRLVAIDSLTGLFARRHCEDRVRSLLDLAERFKQPLTLALLDLDHLTMLNDRHGHAAGDDALSQVGTVLSDGLRGDDVAGRWDGDEFLVAMYGLTSDDAQRRLEAIHHEYRARASHPDPGTTPTFSAGVASWPVDAPTLDRLLTLAGRRLSRAKSEGGVRIVTDERGG